MTVPASSLVVRGLVLGGLAWCLLPLCALAQPYDLSPEQADSAEARAMRDFHGPDLSGKDGPLSNVGMDLLMRYHAFQIQSAGDEEPRLGMASERVTIDAVAQTDAEALRADLEALGLKRGAVAGSMVSGQFPVGTIPEMAKLQSLRSVRLSRAATQQQTQQQNGAIRQKPVPSRLPTHEDTTSTPESPAGSESASPDASVPLRSTDAPQDEGDALSVSTPDSLSEDNVTDGAVDRATQQDAETDSSTTNTETDNEQRGWFLWMGVGVGILAVMLYAWMRRSL